ncbi:MAG TPA: energy transducer TonB [Bacteroidia bacterium]|nr:energy transducer TonB [Bacteroidia bacterium]
MKKLLSLILFITPLFLSAQTDSTKMAADSAAEDTAIAQYSEVLPEYPGGQEAMAKFISKKLKYPKKARKDGIEGKVIVQFVIERDGTTSNHTIVRDIGYGCGEEVVRIIKKMPKWKPGMQKGEAVRVKMVLPVNFKITDE